MINQTYYNRQIKLDEIGLEGQEKLNNCKVLVIGAGGLGSPLLNYLATAGVGNITIYDHDTVDETNLHRRILFLPEDIGNIIRETKKTSSNIRQELIDENLTDEDIAKYEVWGEAT